jgi:hypothetical protein
MAAVFHRVLTLCLAVTLIVGVPGGLVSCGMAEAQVVMSGHTADECSATQPPCADHRSTCIDYLGCAAVPGVAASPALFAVVLEWTSPRYEPPRSTLSGISIEPELSPPILAA